MTEQIYKECLDVEKADDQTLLEIKNLRIGFSSRRGTQYAVDGVSFHVDQGEIVGIVGESGSGKSVMSQSILRLLEYDSNVAYEGEILFQGEDILKFNKKQLQKLRGNDISMIFQNPLTSLSQVHTVGLQLSEILMLHKGMKKKEALERSVELLGLTGIPKPENAIKKYPFELSGGMQQRVMIAMALACEPKLLIADEPTTALDVTIQEQILNLIVELNQKTNMAVLFITHDMGVVSQLCDRVKVMYLGQVVEEAPTDVLFENPKHPYTEGLLACVPSLDSDKEKPLPVIKGTVPPLSKIPAGCHFCTRCSLVDERCKNELPPDCCIAPDHVVKCWRFVQNGDVLNGDDEFCAGDKNSRSTGNNVSLHNGDDEFCADENSEVK